MATTEEDQADDIIVVDAEEDARPRREAPKENTDEARTQRPRPWRVMDDPTLSEPAKRYIARQRARRGESDRKVEEVEAENNQLRQRLDAANAAGLEHYEQAVVARLADAKRELRAATETGDPDKITDASERLAAATTDSAQLQRAKATQPKPQEQQQQQRPRGFTERTQEWVDSNPWFQKDAAEHDSDAAQVAIAIATDMEKNGFIPDTDRYFDELDKRIKREMPHLRRAAKEATVAEEEIEIDEDEEEEKPVQQQQARPAANRAGAAPHTAATTGTTRPSSKTRVALTSEEKDLARSMNIKPEDYARNKLKRELERKERA